jgi:hypothetical protein
MWLLRTSVESEPDPFFLNLTFFAFAGQFIRTAELLAEGKCPKLGLFLLDCAAVLAVLFQVIVYRAHARTTKSHYKKKLAEFRQEHCSDGDVEHWATVMLEITGVDFQPMGYKWLALLFGGEPREKSRAVAYSVLPDDKFRLNKAGASSPVSTSTGPESKLGLMEEDLTLPAKTERKNLWRAYWVLCLLCWFLFITVMITVG